MYKTKRIFFFLVDIRVVVCFGDLSLVVKSVQKDIYFFHTHLKKYCYNPGTVDSVKNNPLPEVVIRKLLYELQTHYKVDCLYSTK